MPSKAQISFIETIMVTLVVVIMLGLAMFFYFRFYGESLVETGEALRAQESTILLSTLTALPELQCSTRTIDKPCLDAMKLFVMPGHAQRLKSHYIPLLGKKVIKVEQLYPAVFAKECTLTDAQQPNFPGNCNTWLLYSNPNPRATSKDILSTPVSLYYPTVEQYAIGKLIIEVYA